MDEATFWALVEAAKAEATPALSNQAALLQKRLEALPPQEIVAFDRTFTRLHHDAYRWDLWAAAYIIEGGCSDDGFMDFRAGLIGLGRDAYRAAIEDPGTLARQPTRGVDFSNEAIVRRSEGLAGQQVVSMESCCGGEAGGLFVCRPPKQGP